MDIIMYDLTDTICAISSGKGQGLRHIVRLSGSLVDESLKVSGVDANPRAGVSQCKINIPGFEEAFNAMLYYFPQGRSYSGEIIAELHLYSPLCVAELLIERLCCVDGVRMAGPGEFTFRAFMNGKISLAQSEAVAQIVAGSNALQVEAAQRLLKGRLTGKINELKAEIIELLSLFEAGMDFADEEIIFISPEQAAERVEKIAGGLKELIESNLKYERMIGLPSVAMAGVPNAGKSSLTNAILGSQRSIVSATKATTRDILTDLLTLEGQNCVLSDCAGILDQSFADEIDKIAQKAALEYISHADLVLFCVEAGKPDLTEEKIIFSKLKGKNIIAICTKTDKVSDAGRYGAIFGVEFIDVSIRCDESIARLKAEISSNIASLGNTGEQILAVNKRHYDSVSLCLEDVYKAADLFRIGDEELAALMLREAYTNISDIDEQKNIDEKILDTIFSSFCIGK